MADLGRSAPTWTTPASSVTYHDPVQPTRSGRGRAGENHHGAVDGGVTDAVSPIRVESRTMDAKPPNTKRPGHMNTRPPTTKSSGRSPSLAALLSFLWPGLGQLYIRKRRAAALFAVPAVLVLLLLAYGLRRGPVVFAAQLFADRTVGLAAVAILLLFGAWRLAAVVHAFAGGERRKTHRIVDRAVVAALAAVIVISHLGAGYYLLAVTSDAGSQVFAQAGNVRLIDPATPGPSLAPGQTPQPERNPSRAGGRAAASPSCSPASMPPHPRSEHLYDSIMVVSYDPKTNSVQMVSVPRDSASFPLYFGGVDSASTKINSIPPTSERLDQVARQPLHDPRQRGQLSRRHPHQLLRRHGPRWVRGDDRQRSAGSTSSIRV